MPGVSVSGLVVTYFKRIFKPGSLEGCKKSSGKITSGLIGAPPDAGCGLGNGRNSGDRIKSSSPSRESIQRLENELRIVNEQVLELETRLQRLALF
jgi:hypothetical protein